MGPVNIVEFLRRKHLFYLPIPQLFGDILQETLVSSHLIMVSSRNRHRSHGIRRDDYLSRVIVAYPPVRKRFQGDGQIFPAHFLLYVAKCLS